MPREIADIKEFLLTARRKDAKSVKIKEEYGERQVQDSLQPIFVHVGRKCE